MVWKSPPASTKNTPERLDPCVWVDGEETGAHIAAGDIGLDDDVVAIGRKDAAADFQCLVRMSAAQIRPDADLGAKPVGFDEIAGRRHRRLDQPFAVARQPRRRHGQAERGEHRAGAELVLAEREQRSSAPIVRRPKSRARAGAAPPRK